MDLKLRIEHLSKMLIELASLIGKQEERLSALEDRLLAAAKGGAIGGKSRSEAKVNAARANGKKGGRPLKTP